MRPPQPADRGRELGAFQREIEETAIDVSTPAAGDSGRENVENEVPQYGNIGRNPHAKFAVQQYSIESILKIRSFNALRNSLKSIP
jgi:hypothetical protein